MKLITELLHASHHKAGFDCGNDLLNHYIRNQATQDIRRKLSACFVLTEEQTRKVKGYYTLSNSGISRDLVPIQVKKKMPQSYLLLPATLLGRLAVDIQYQQQGIGRDLLVEALMRSHEISHIIGSYAVIVDPVDEGAEAFYSRYGFIKLPGSGKMFLPMNTIGKLFGQD